MKKALSIALCAVTLAAGARDTKVVLKLDDLTPKGAKPGEAVNGNWRRVVDFLAKERVPASIGLIGAGCENASPEFWAWVKSTFGAGGQFELWNHGYTHSEKPRVKGKRQCEFSGPGADEQRATWRRTFDLVKANAGIEMSTLGAPFNQVDQNTVEMLKRTPEVKAWFYGWNNAPAGVTVLPRACDLEFPVMKPNFEKAKEQFLSHGVGKVFAVQGHAGAWKPAQFEEFRKYVLFLKEQGVTFVLPRDLNPGDVPRPAKSARKGKGAVAQAIVNAIGTANGAMSDQSLKMQYGEGECVVRLDKNHRERWSLRGGRGRAEVRDGHVEVGVREDGANAIFQYDLPVRDKGWKALRLSARWRLQDVGQGKDKWMQASIQARWKKGNAETGGWLVVAKGTGTTDWRQANLEAAVPDDVDGLMIRVANYGTRGHIDVEDFTVTAFGGNEIIEDSATVPKEPYGEAPSRDRLARFSRGVSINQWFDQPFNGRIKGEKGGFTRDWQDRYVTDRELKDLAHAGIRCIRLPLDPEPYIDLTTGEVKDCFEDVLTALRRIRAAGLAICFNPHPKMQGFKKMGSMPVVRESFLKWSAAVAARLEREFGPDNLLYEPLNEPSMSGFSTVDSWIPYQNRLVEAIRKAAPELTLVLNAGRWQNVDDLLTVSAHPDRNTIWSVHYYEPMAFTHQGSPWMRSWYQPLRGVPWPYGPEEAKTIVARLDRTGRNAAYAQEAAAVLTRQANDGRGSRDRVTKDFEKLARWAKDNGRTICIGEFGVDASFALEDDRLRWTREVRELCDRHGFVWQYWSYDNRLRLSVGEPGERTLEKPVFKALGL